MGIVREFFFRIDLEITSVLIVISANLSRIIFLCVVHIFFSDIKVVWFHFLKLVIEKFSESVRVLA